MFIKHQYTVYILASKKNGTLYIGMTNNIERRVFEHKNKLVKGFTSKYDITILVYYKTYSVVLEAIKMEKQMKKWNRQWKIDLIETGNPEWNDLAADWYLDYD